MQRTGTFLIALFLLASAEALAQGRIIRTFPYTQDFSWVTGTTTAFPAANVPGGEFTVDANTPVAWTNSITNHGLGNNGGGGIRIQPTVANGDAGFIWYGSFTCFGGDSLVIDWEKVQNGAAGTRIDELRIATNNGAGGTFTDLPLANVVGGAWPSFDNSATAQSGTLRVMLPASLTGSPDARIRIYSTNTGGSGNLPRVVVDNLSITGTPIAPATGTIDSIGNAGHSTQTLFYSAGADADSLLVIRRTGAAPAAAPVDGARYTVGQGLNATDTVVYSGPASPEMIRFTGLQPTTTYHYAVYGLRTCNGLYSDAPATASAATLDCSGAPAGVTDVTTITRAQDSLVIGYATGGRTDSVLIIKSRNTAPTATPTTGTRYAVGQVLSANDTVVYFGPPSSPFVPRNLQADSLYFFAFYSFQSCNATYSTTVARDTARTYCEGTVGNVADVSVRFRTSATIGLSITPTTAATGYIVFVNGPDTALPRPVTGIPYTVGTVIGDDTVRYMGPSRLPVITGLNPSTTYKFTAYGVRVCNYAYSATGDTVRGTTLAPCAVGVPSVVDSVRISRNVRDTVTIRWRPTANAGGYVIVARIDSTPTMAPMNGTFYAAGDTLGNGTFILGTSSDSSATLIGYPANTAYFFKVYAYRECDLAYGPATMVTPFATRGTATSQRFAIRAGSKDTIRFAGAVVEFRTPVSADGSLLITRNSGPMSLNGIPMSRSTEGEPPITTLSTDRWWSFRKAGLGTTRVDLAFDITGLPGVNDTSDLEIVFRTAPHLPWEDFITTGYTTDSVTTYLLADNREFLSSEYAIGAYGPTNPLPVNLLSFDGYSRDGRNFLRWRTAQEKENAGFRLYRASADGDESSFHPVADYVSDARLRGAGTSSTPRDYGYIDESEMLRTGSAYLYKLEEVALDGSSNEIGRLLLSIDNGARPASLRFRVVPNPVSGGSATINYVIGGDGPVTITLVNAVGEEVRTLVRDEAATAGSRSIRIDVADLPAGLYFCRVAGGGETAAYPVTVVR